MWGVTLVRLAMAEKNYKLNLARYAKQAFDSLTPHEKRVLRQMMADDPAPTPDEAKASDERWLARLRAFARLRAKAAKRNSVEAATSTRPDAIGPRRGPAKGDAEPDA